MTGSKYQNKNTAFFTDFNLCGTANEKSGINAVDGKIHWNKFQGKTSRKPCAGLVGVLKM